jgi:hypothetical protein
MGSPFPLNTLADKFRGFVVDDVGDTHVRTAEEGTQLLVSLR